LFRVPARTMRVGRAEVPDPAVVPLPGEVTADGLGKTRSLFARKRG